MPFGSSTRQLSVNKTWPHLRTLDNNTKATLGIDIQFIPFLLSAVYLIVNFPLFSTPVPFESFKTS